jgi:outer membrane protein TolC
MRKLLIILLMFCTHSLSAQEELSFNMYMDWVQSYHPVAKLADINLRFGEQELLAARGGFDPKIFADYSTKKFKNTEYYDSRVGGIGIPTWGGVEFKGILEQNSGTFLNPEQTVPSDGLIALGASVNLGQGLFIDNRRAALRQAQIFQEATKAERQQILNDLFLDATDAYWKWAADYKNLIVFEEGLRLAEERFEMVKESFIQGDFPAIDTVEAYTQVMDRLYRLQNAQVNFFQTTQFINTFLWDENEEPVDLMETIFPEDVLDPMLYDYSKESLRMYVLSHPELQLKDFDIASTEIERRFKADLLKPVVRVDYNFLTERANSLQVSPFLQNDYKLGLTFAMPLFLRKERGSLGFTKAKLDFKNYERELKLLQLKTKLEGEIFNFETVEQQLVVFSNNVNGLQKLLDGEVTRFDLGESSLFLVNAREVSLFNAEVTLNDLAAKRKTAYAKMLNAAGLGFDD